VDGRRVSEKIMRKQQPASDLCADAGCLIVFGR
jgi:hypothetical protein